MLRALFAVCLSASRPIYLVVGTIALYCVGIWSTAAGHGPFTFLEAIGSWFSVVLHAVFGIDTWLLGSALWAKYLDSTNADALLLVNIGMVTAPVGFLAYFSGMKCLVRRCLSGPPYSSQVVVHVAGAVVAASWGILSRIAGGLKMADLAFALAGVGVAGLFVAGDLLLMRVTRPTGADKGGKSAKIGHY